MSLLIAKSISNKIKEHKIRKNQTGTMIKPGFELQDAVL